MQYETIYHSTVFYNIYKFICSVKLPAGCNSLITTNLTIISLDTSLTKISDTLKANLTGAIYQWFDCTTGASLSFEKNQIFIAQLIGNYAVQLSKSGCIDTSSC